LRFAQERRRSADRAALSTIYGRPMPMADGLLIERAADHALRCWRQRDHGAHGFRSTASTLLNDEGVFTNDVEAQLDRTWRKSFANRTSLARVTKTISQVAMTARSIMPNAGVCAALSDRLVSLREGASAVSLRRSAA